ncbi:NfeD family protein [Sphingomonas sp. H160509]|uniref:NfeD family protein n=1 Tax=Sphingomonas sp. H160509 TaxID=2955313 RepID=UPI00209852E6|nr:NfeD family protein [Sphingomonas sp. H160509]MDD1450543.1 NfeD family protein [Sphingomonas sp. H160509]
MDAIGAAGAWLIAALVLGIAGLAVPGVFLMFLAIAAAVTGVAVFVLPDLPVAAQLAAFGIWSAVAVLIGKRWYRDYPVEGGDPMLNDRSARLVGQVVVVETALVSGRGRVLVGDGSWPARGEDAAVGVRVRVAAVVDGEVVVEPL